MTLRTKLLSLFTLLAVGPLLAIGVIGYALSQRAVTRQLEDQTRLLAERSALEIRRRVDLVDSDLLLMAENAESERPLRLRTNSPDTTTAQYRAALASAHVFLRDAWDLFGSSYAVIELRDAAGTPVIRLGDASDPVGAHVVEHTLAARGVDGAQLGSIRALVHVEALLPVDALDARFGRGGVTAVVHRPTGHVLHLSSEEAQLPAQVTEADHAESGVVRADSAGSARVGWVSTMAAPPLAVLSLADRAEFAAPFQQQRTTQLLLVLLLAASVIPAAAFLIRRATGSLEELTAAADRVGRGDFTPDLPRPSSDEVGTLTTAFGAMTGEIRRMVREIERSRQLAAVGEFAAELSHEIRNPLTALKLNLQRIQRMIAADGRQDDAEKPILIALNEVNRLDRVVRSVLRLGRPTADLEKHDVALDHLLERAVSPIREQLDAQHIHLRVDRADAVIVGDEEALAGALINLLLNAVEAMPEGGTLHMRSTVTEAEDGAWADIHIADTGTGIDDAARARLFRPFVTTKQEGTGLGLVLALRTAEAHGGTVTLTYSTSAGTEFRMRLPLARRMVHT